ncbi:MAG: ABC transporter permease [Solirubrobacterales bacterium]|nr:ABC transporter permease [Solirubrobacterales bacterium]
MSDLALVVHQFRFEQKVFWRSPAAVFFTVMFPVIFLLIFSSLFGDEVIEEIGIRTTVYYVPGIITLAVVSASLVSTAIRLTEMRESGRLKRVRGTPLPPWAFVAGRFGNSLVVSILMVAVVTAIGHFLYDVPVPTQTIPALLVTLLVGSFTFCTLGFALTALIPNEDAAPPVTNFVVLPLYFLSGVFIPQSEIPEGVLHFSSIFPIRHFFECFLTAYDPQTTGAGFEWVHLGILAVWGVAGLLLALRFFRWTPKGT